MQSPPNSEESSNADIEHLNSLIEFNPNYAEAYYERGLVYYLLGNYEQVLADCTKAIELNPDYAEAYYNRGRAKRRIEQHESAIDDFDTAIRLDPDDTESYYHRALAKAEQALTKGTQEQLWAAKQDFQTALNLAKRGGNEELEVEIERLIPEIEQWIQEAQESSAQQKPEGGMCGIIVLVCVIVGILVSLNFIF